MKERLENAGKHVGCGLKGYDGIREDIKGNNFGLMKEEDAKQ